MTLTNGAGGNVVAPRGEVMLNAQNQPESAVMTGGVKYGSEDPLRQAQGEAAEGKAGFDNKGRLEHVMMTGASANCKSGCAHRTQRVSRGVSGS